MFISISFQTVDTFAVCSNCSRLSYNLKQCDKCGCPLSEDNTVPCYGADPKRARIESSPPTTSASSLVNGNTENSKDSTDSSTTRRDSNDTMTEETSSTAQPVPQTLFVNKNAPLPEVRPQALYFNLTNQNPPSLNVTTGSTGSGSMPVTPTMSGPRTTVPASAHVSLGHVQTSSMLSAASQTAASQASAAATGITLHTGLTGQQNSMAAMPSNTTVQSLNGITSSQALGTVRLNHPPAVAPPPLVPTQSHNSGTVLSPGNMPFNSGLPPPPYSVAQAVRANGALMTGNMSGGVAPVPTTAVAILSAAAAATPSTSPATAAAVVPVCTVSPSSITMPVYQIRIGPRKFLAASPVTFKEDGILVALKSKFMK